MKDRIIELRNKLNLTQTEFGEKIGLTRKVIYATILPDYFEKASMHYFVPYFPFRYYRR